MAYSRAQTRERLAREGRTWADLTRENLLRRLNARQVDGQLTGRGVGATAPLSQAQIQNTPTTSRNRMPTIPRSYNFHGNPNPVNRQLHPAINGNINREVAPPSYESLFPNRMSGRRGVVNNNNHGLNQLISDSRGVLENPVPPQVSVVAPVQGQHPSQVNGVSSSRSSGTLGRVVHENLGARRGQEPVMHRGHRTMQDVDRNERRRQAVVNGRDTRQRETAALDEGLILTQVQQYLSTPILLSSARESISRPAYVPTPSGTRYGDEREHEQRAALARHRQLLEGIWADLQGIERLIRGI